MLVEELLEKIVGEDNVSRHFFRFMQYVQKLQRLKMYVTTVDGESTITDVKAFVENLKRYIDKHEIKAQKIVDGVRTLWAGDDVILRD
jgi:hypothetical protein